VFTTAPTRMGVTFNAVAPEHPLATHAAQGNPGSPLSSTSASQLSVTGEAGPRDHGEEGDAHPVSTSPST